jgi:hypothetical protein
MEQTYGMAYLLKVLSKYLSRIKKKHLNENSQIHQSDPCGNFRLCHSIFYPVIAQNPRRRE